MCFPRDKKEAWELLLSWAYNRNFPRNFTLQGDSALNAFHAWLLGRKRGVRAFSDAIMKKLLHGRRNIPWDILAAGWEIEGVGSKLGCFLAEETVFRLNETKEITTEHLEDLSGQDGFVTDLVHALARYRRHGPYLFDYFPPQGFGRLLRWRCLMIGGDRSNCVPEDGGVH